MTGIAESTLSAETIVAFLAEVIGRRGAESYLGEDVTMAEHMLQAACLAEQADAGDALVAAALLHDIGHYTGEFPEDALEQGIDNRHDRAGAAVIEPFFPALVTACVRHHVAAKRYLCATDPGYHERLSPASVHSLSLQGGPMTAAEVAAFRNNPHLDDILRVRIWDDEAKVPGRATPPLAHYLPILQRVVNPSRRKHREA